MCKVNDIERCGLDVISIRRTLGMKGVFVWCPFLFCSVDRYLTILILLCECVCGV